MSLKDWSLTASDNDTVSDGTLGNISWAEGQNPNTVNDSARAEMSHVRHFYENIEWRDWGHTPVYSSATVFTVSSASDLSSVYRVGRRIKATDSSTLYGIITISSYAAATQTVTVALDSGSLSASLTNIALGFDPTNSPIVRPVYGARAYRTTDQSHNSGSATWDTVVWQAANYNDNTAVTLASGLVTVPTGFNFFKVHATVQFDANATGYRNIAIATDTSTDGSTIFENGMPLEAFTAIGTRVSVITGWIPISVASSFYVLAFQNSGGNLTMQASAARLYVEFK